ncbi:hypothetical protein [Bradyrhizobium sp. USDA 3364]
MFPLGIVFGLFFRPAWLLVAIGRLPRLTLALGVCGLVAFAVLWAQLSRSFRRRSIRPPDRAPSAGEGWHDIASRLI